MRKRISEQNFFPNFDLYKEYYKIEVLISEKKILGVYNKFGKFIHDYFTLEEYIEYICFNDWNLRGTFTSIAEMRVNLGIESGTITPESINENQVLDFLQYAINCLNRAKQSMTRAPHSLFSDDTIETMLRENIESLIRKLNCTTIFEKKNHEIFVIYNNTMASVISKEHHDVKDSIMEYLQIDNRGDLKRKEEILCSLYKKLESCAETFKGTTYKNLYDDTKLLFNKSGVRHNVEKDSIACATFLTMDKEEVEKWYDKIFDMFLSCMEIYKYLSNKVDIDNLKKGICT